MLLLSTCRQHAHGSHTGGESWQEQPQGGLCRHRRGLRGTGRPHAAHPMCLASCSPPSQTFSSSGWSPLSIKLISITCRSNKKNQPVSGRGIRGQQQPHARQAAKQAGALRAAGRRTAG